MAAYKTIDDLVGAFEKLHVLVVGDSMIDTYISGKSDRTSPEAAVPVVNYQGEESRLGGAANVAVNLRSFGCEVSLVSVVGEDKPGTQFMDLMAENKLATDLVLVEKGRQTTQKQRIYDRGSQVLRIDREDTYEISGQQTSRILELLEDHWSVYDVLIFQDYDKGLITPALINEIMTVCGEYKIPVLADPKERNYFNYRGVQLFKPNRREFESAHQCKLDLENPVEFKKLCHNAYNTIGADILLLTLSGDGLLVVKSNEMEKIPAAEIALKDVAGAGDTVIAMASICTALHLSPQLTGILCNLAGGLVCRHEKVVPLDRAEFIARAGAVIEQSVMNFEFPFAK